MERSDFFFGTEIGLRAGWRWTRLILKKGRLILLTRMMIETSILMKLYLTLEGFRQDLDGVVDDGGAAIVGGRIYIHIAEKRREKAGKR